MNTLKEYFEKFGVSEIEIKKIIYYALSKGGDYCDLYFQQKDFNYIGLEDNQVNRAYSNVDFGVGIRVLNGYQTGYSFTEEISLEAMKNAALTAANIANSKKTYKPVNFEINKAGNYYNIKNKWENISIEKKIPYLQKINNQVFILDNRIIKSNILFSDTSSYILFANSDGLITFDYQPMSKISVSCIAEQNGVKEQNGYGISGRRGIDFFSESNLSLLATEAVQRTVKLFESVKPDVGEMELVMAKGGSGILLHEAIGHGMEADFNRKDISIFSNKINKKVAEDFVSIVDDGTNPYLRGSINIDDEGNSTEKTLMVENGILRSYLHDKLSSQFYKTKPTGNGRRQSFRYAPMPRMRNTYMLPGPHTKNEIIESVKKGIYAESFSNGQVHIGGGDFTFYIKLGYMIENGKLTKPIKDVNIIGNGPKVLKNITMVANDLEVSQGAWMCGKEGQSVPVSVGLPTIKVSKITVGGKH